MPPLQRRRPLPGDLPPDAQIGYSTTIPPHFRPDTLLPSPPSRREVSGARSPSGTAQSLAEMAHNVPDVVIVVLLTLALAGTGSAR